MPMKIILTGGGTAGHVTPNMALLPALYDAGFAVEYIGGHNGPEKTQALNMRLAYHGISTGKLRRFASFKNFTDLFRIAAGFFGAYKILVKTKPDIIFSKGGFVGVPVCYAAFFRNIPVILHEADYTMGLANRLCVPFCKKICTSFEETAGKLKKGIYTGLPIRAEFFNGDKEYGGKICCFSRDLPVIIVIGGSMGAKKINDVLREALPSLLGDYNIIHLTGRGNRVEFTADGYFQMEYADKELPHLYAMSDIVVSRAGANAVAEISALNKPALYIPLGTDASRGDQIQNADYCVKRGFARVLQNNDLTPDRLTEEIKYLRVKADEHRKALTEAKTVDAVQNVLRVILAEI